MKSTKSLATDHCSFTLSELAKQINAQLEGASTEATIVGVATLARAGEQEISFFTNRLYREELAKTQAAAVILAPQDRRYCPVPMLVTNNPYLGYAKAAALLNPPVPHTAGIHATAWVSPQAVLDPSVCVGAQAVVEAGARIGRQVHIGPGCIVAEGVIIGDNSHLVAHVTLWTNTRVGQRVIIHPGAVIGADGFGQANDKGVWIKIPQLGGVVIGDDVEVGANTTIDKGALEDTIIGCGVKLDNQIQIGHNVQVGEHTIMAGCVGVSGSTRIGRHCMIGGGVGIAGHIEIVDNVQVTGGSLIMQSILQPGLYSSGTPLETNQRWHRNYHRFKQLDDIAKRLQTLERTLK